MASRRFFQLLQPFSKRVTIVTKFANLTLELHTFQLFGFKLIFPYVDTPLEYIPFDLEEVQLFISAVVTSALLEDSIVQPCDRDAVLLVVSNDLGVE